MTNPRLRLDSSPTTRLSAVTSKKTASVAVFFKDSPRGRSSGSRSNHCKATESHFGVYNSAKLASQAQSACRQAHSKVPAAQKQGWTLTKETPIPGPLAASSFAQALRRTGRSSIPHYGGQVVPPGQRRSQVPGNFIGLLLASAIKRVRLS